MRVVFMGTPEFSVPALDALVASGHEIAAVYCQPPRPAGRGKRERPTAVHHRALAHGLDVRTPRSLRDPDAQTALAGLEADVGVVVAYGLILPQPVLSAPRFGCLNIHASLLPRWRGAAPIHRAVMAGDAETGVCIMQMEAGLDTGPVLTRASVPIGPDATTGSLHADLSVLGAGMVVDVLSHLPMEAVAQNDVGVTYAHKIDKSEARIDWTKSAAAVDRQIRGLSPFPGAWTELGGDRLKLLASRYLDQAEGEPGQVIHAPLTVACGTGAVEVLRAQRAGRGAQTADDLIRGFPLPVGTRMG
ncbi:MAG: methionyl-tRNA formyltransferase [Pseudomonadota bacterium]